MEKYDQYLQKFYTNNLREGYDTYGGYTLPNCFTKIKEKILDFDVRNQDVWIITYPKSGTTWTQEMVWMILNNIDIEKGSKSFIQDRSPYLECSVLLDADHYSSITKSDVEFPNPFTDSIGYVEKRYKQEPRLSIKSHLPWELLPRQIQDSVKKPKIIYVRRNPKDVCVSFYWHATRFGFTGSFDTFSELFLAGKIPYAPYWAHVKSYCNRRNQSNILVLTYEEMQKDLAGVIHKVSSFVDVPLSEDQISRLSDHLNFENMKKNPTVNYDQLPEILSAELPLLNKISFMRKGISGSFKETMSAELAEKFDKWIEENCVNGINGASSKII